MTRTKRAPAPGKKQAEAAKAVVRRLSVEYVSVDDLNLRDDNPKDHDIGAIIMSLREFGYTDPVGIDEATGKLVDGHGRIFALRSMREAGEQPPAGVEVRGGKWFVPVIMGVRFKDDLQALAYVIAANRTTELGGWLDPKLAEALQRLPKLDGTGFNDEDLQALMKRLAGPVLGDPLDEGIAAVVRVCICPTCGHEHHAAK